MAGRGTIGWAEPVLVVIAAAVLWLIVGFALGLVAGLALISTGHTQEFIVLSTHLGTDFFSLQSFTAIFYAMLLIVLRLSLRRRRGLTLTAGYFPSVGVKSALLGALSGLLLTGASAGILAWLIAGSGFHPTAAEAALRPNSLVRLVVSVLVAGVLAPIAEEAYFRGLLLDWFQQKFPPALAAVVTAIIFAAVHLRFIGHAGIVGWAMTADLAVLGVVNAIWAQRTRSLRAPVAAHASYNVALLLVSFALP
jgi:membrane protease YdiL (CAAX protease family)